MKRIIAAAALCSALIAAAAPLPAGACPGLPNLDVELLDSLLVPLASAVTDEAGDFAFTGLAAGDYVLSVTDPLSNLSATLDFTVPVEKDPAALQGRVACDEGSDLSLFIAGSLHAENEIGPFDISFRLKWNSNSIHSNGWFAVVVTGAAVETIEAVTLTSEIGSISPERLKHHPEELKVTALFRKKDAYQALVPEGLGRGDTVDITVVVDTVAGPQEETFTLKILGKK